ncbi:MAG: hypothetical protein DI538_20660 [Azospira oryzae]|nr:MAG: hypothetical protein DI538_20660 [Azospira oryzae]
MARCLAGECSPEESIQLNELLAADVDLKADYDTLKWLMYDKCESTPEVDLKDKFNRISRRLEEDGLM